MIEEELYHRVVRLETIQEEHAKLLNSQIEKNETLVEMKTLIKRQIEDSEKRDNQMEKFSDTLNKVNENLTNLNINQQQMKVDMSEIGSRVTDIEKFQEEGKIDTAKLIKGILSYVATGCGSVAIAVVIWYLTK